jgi:hypothetical protein
MSQCPGTDALVTIAGALEWDVEAGLKHLTTCESCSEELRALHDVHAAYEAEEPVPDRVLARIDRLVADAAVRERAWGRRAQNLGDIVEALLAGATALAVLAAGGLQMPATLSVTVFAITATSLFGYRVFASSHSTAARNSSPSIQ